MSLHGGVYNVTKVRTAGKTQENFQESELLKWRSQTLLLSGRLCMHAARACAYVYVYMSTPVLRYYVEQWTIGAGGALRLPCRRRAAARPPTHGGNQARTPFRSH